MALDVMALDVSPDEEREVCVCFAGMDSAVLREMKGEYVTR